MPEDTLTITDDRTGRQYTLPITDGTIRATDLRQIGAADGDHGLMSYDPAFLNTASCRSTITYIDGDAGILRYRGYPIEQLAEEAGFLETAFLLLEGELPTAAELGEFEETVRSHTYVHTNVQKFLEGFRYDAHPMGMLLGAVGALSTFYPDAKQIGDIGEPEAPARPSSREAPDDRGIRLSPLARTALCPAEKRPRVRRQLRQHDVRDRRATRAERGAPALARDPARACMRITSRTARRVPSGASAPRRSTRSRQSPPESPPFTGRSTVARTRPCCECSTRSGT